MSPVPVSTSTTSVGTPTGTTSLASPTTSSPSAAASVAASLRPGRPSGVVAVPGEGSLSVSWRRPSGGGGSPVSGYRVEWRSGRSGAWSSAEVSGASTLSYVITGLTGGSLYWVRIRARNAEGVGVVSTNYARGTPVDRSVTVTVPVGKPSPPQGLSVAPGSAAGSIAVSWGAPPSGGGSPVSGYVVQWRRLERTSSGSRPVGNWISGAETTALSYTINTSHYGASFLVRVKAYNESRKSSSIFIPSFTSCLQGDKYVAARWGCESPCGPGDAYDEAFKGCRPAVCPAGRDVSGYCALYWPSTVPRHPNPPPVYSRLDCRSYSASSNASTYLDFSGDDSKPVCPPMGLFLALGERRRVVYREADHYYPVWADSPYHNEDYKNSNADFGYSNQGKIILRADGACSFIRDTFLHYDFQVPCKAHDYCYDLARAGLHRTTGTGRCDTVFRSLLISSCNNRFLGSSVEKGACTVEALFLTGAVQDVGVSPEPGRVRIRNVYTGKCLTMTSKSPTLFANSKYVVQKRCDRNNVLQHFYVVQSSESVEGPYMIKAASASSADGGLGAGNSCLSSVDDRPVPSSLMRPMFRPALGLGQVLVIAADCSTRRDCRPGLFIGWTTCERSVYQRGTLTRSPGGLINCVPRGTPPNCGYSVVQYISRSDAVFVEGNYLGPTSTRLPFPDHEYELRQGIEEYIAAYPYATYPLLDCWKPDDSRGTVIQGDSVLHGAAVQADNLVIAISYCGRGRLDADDRLTRWRFEELPWHVPAPVDAFAVTGQQPDSIIVFWQPSPSGGVYPIESYTVMWERTAVGSSLASFTGNAESVEVPVSSLRLTSKVPGEYNPDGLSYYTYTLTGLQRGAWYSSGVIANDVAGFSSTVGLLGSTGSLLPGETPPPLSR